MARTAAALVAFALAATSTPRASGQIGGSLVVAITSPAGGSTVGGTIPVNASVTIVGLLTVQGVQFKLDGANLGAEDTSAPYSVQWDTRAASNASHTLTAVGRDALGMLWTSNPVVVTVFNDKTPPVVAMTSPSPGAYLRGTATVGASATDNVGVVGVQFKLDGANLGAEVTAGPYLLSWNTAAATAGAHSLTAVARDAAGNTATSTGVAVTVDNAPPAVALTAPGNGASVAGTTTVSANATDNVAVAGVQFKLDGANLGAEDTTSPYSVSWNTTGTANGSHTLTAVARDAAGNTTTSTAVAATVDNAPPAVALTAPGNGASVAGTTTVSGNATDNVAVAGVQFKLDGANLGAEDTASPYSVSWNTTGTANGSHALTAVARDAAGNVTTSAVVTVTVSNDATPPSVSVTAPAGGANVSATVTVTANASDNVAVVGVQFKLDGTNLGAEDTATPYSVSWDTRTASNASHTLTAVARDAAGNTTTSSSVGVIVDNIAPVIAMTAPGSGDSLSGTTTLSADATDNIRVAGVQFKLDGANLGAEVTASPYQMTWNSATASEGSHTLTAVARDAAGNAVTSSGVAVVVDHTSPAVALTAPADGARIAGTITISADSSDNIGVASVRFMLDGAPLGAEVTTAPFAAAWDTTTVTSGMHALSAEARDRAGNLKTSATVTVMISQTATRIENTEVSITYTAGNGTNGQSPNWWSGSRSRDWSGKVASFTRGDGARASFTFTGSTIRWIGFRAPWAGIARVYVDGAFVTELDLYQTTEEPRAVIFARTGLGAGPHMLTVECTGRRNPSATDDVVVVDAFDVAPAAPAPVTGTRVEDPALTFGAGWTAEAAGVRNWSGGSAQVSATPGAQATYSFIGTEVRWVGLRGPQNGIARVYLDGSFHAQVDTYAPMELETVVFTAMNLTPGRHTMTIEVTGDKSAASTGTSVVVDGLDVRSRFEDQDQALTHTADWRDPFVNGLWSGTSANRTGLAWLSNTAGGQASFTFSGTSVSWIGSRGPLFGIARVLVDGAYVTDVDTYAAVQQDQMVLFNASGLTDAAHTVTIQPTGGKNASAIGAWIVVDAFDVTLSPQAPSIARLQETDASVTYSSGWNSFRYPLFAGETMAGSTTPGAQATLSFTGTAVRWIGQYAFGGGIARVYLDGVPVASVDTYSPLEEEEQATMYDVAGLANGSHTLTIEVTGQKNVGSQGTSIYVDAFDIH